MPSDTTEFYRACHASCLQISLKPFAHRRLYLRARRVLHVPPGPEATLLHSLCTRRRDSEPRDRWSSGEPAEGNIACSDAAASPQLESGNWYLPYPTLAPWVEQFIGECGAFPAHDDQVDAWSQRGKASDLFQAETAGANTESRSDLYPAGHDRSLLDGVVESGSFFLMNRACLRWFSAAPAARDGLDGGSDCA